MRLSTQFIVNLFVRYVTKHLFKHHIYMIIHSVVRRYICQMCDKRFTTSSLLYQHELIHKDERTYVCKTCNKRFNQAVCLYKHQRYHCTQRCEQTKMRHVRQINCLVYVCCECHQSFYHMLDTSY